ncbi:MAG: lysophospholipid acyltransferase family protein [Bacteriovoracaceae bacterium]|nr:lysophospholipid acyltransferase family protein [Bacteriovoracaceae bacterium]
MDKTYNLALLPDKLNLNEKFSKSKSHYLKNPDPFGLDVDKFANTFRLLLPLYEHYFNVRVFGAENIQKINSNRMFVSNHTGQLPIDGLLLAMATFLHSTPRPIILRGMGERFLMGLPFLGKFSMENGVILGDRKNCEICMKRGENVLTFPEGVRGISKSTPDFYRMQKFSLGFLRMALHHKTPIQPVVVIGAEEMYPLVWQAPKIAKMLGFPSFPLTPFFPWFGPMGMIPLPSPVDIYFLPPMELPDGHHAAQTDEELMPFVVNLHKMMQNAIDAGRKEQRPTIKLKKIIDEIPPKEFWIETLNRLKNSIVNKNEK